MTTIAYKDGIIAYDSRLTSNYVVADDDYDKHITRDGVEFFIAGDTSDYEILINNYFSNVIKSRRINAIAIIYDNGELYTVSVDSTGRFWKCKERLDNVVAVGSGENFALAFMDAGLSAIDAVKMTANRDVFTGGKINYFELPV